MYRRRSLSPSECFASPEWRYPAFCRAHTHALAQMDAGTLGVTTYLVPALVVALGWMLLAEVPPALAVAGGAVCLAGVALSRPRRRARPSFFEGEDGIRDIGVTGVQTCALPIWFGSGRVAAYGLALLGVIVWTVSVAPNWLGLAAALLVLGALDAIVDVAQNAHGLRVQRLYQQIGRAQGRERV